MISFRRPPFDAEGRATARRALQLGERQYEPGQELAAEDREQLTTRQLATLWQQGVIDTPPREPSDAELERLTAPGPSVQRGKQQPQQRR